MTFLAFGKGDFTAFFLALYIHWRLIQRAIPLRDDIYTDVIF